MLADHVNAHMRARLCRTEHGPCEPVPAAVATYFGSDQPRITVEVSLPWHELGLAGPPPARQLRMELAATAWYHSRWMSWSGLQPEEGMREPAQWRTVRLRNNLRQP
jgi:hypothetical protein